MLQNSCLRSKNTCNIHFSLLSKLFEVNDDKMESIFGANCHITVREIAKRLNVTHNK